MTATLTNGFSYSQNSDGTIVFHFENSNRETVDSWLDIGLQIDHYAASQKLHLRTLYILKKNLFITPYGIKKIVQASQLTPPNLYESMAVVVGGKSSYSLFRLILKQLTQMTQANSNFFAEEHQAQQWLDQRTQYFIDRWKVHPLTQRLGQDFFIKDKLHETTNEE
jgi:hypothetical protein